MAAGRTLYVRVGVLVLVGLALSFAFVIFLAGQTRSTQMVTFETYTQESVQGLDVGAAVRYRGVRIGRVTEIALASAEYRRREGRPFSEAFQLVVVRFAVDQASLGETPSLEEAIRLGLRARITGQGITGVNYVELDFARNPPPFVPPPWTPRFAVVPSIPSTVAQAREAAEVLIARISEIPIEQMAQDVAELLSNTNRQVGEGDIAIALREAAASMALIRAALEQGDIAGSLAEFRAVATDLRATLSGPEMRAALANTSAAAAELRRTAQRLPGAVDGFERTMRSARETTVDVQAELLPILMDLRATTASLRATAEQLRASPSQTLFGAPPTPDRRR
jgi:ABC-type transporter Mla subunit MlaD